MHPRPVFVLGPQRKVPLVRDALRHLGRTRGIRPVALVSAGWEERELEHDELEAHVGRPVVNLEVFRRVEEIYREDPDLHAAVRERHDRMRRLHALYRIRLGHAVEAARELLRAEVEAELAEPERSASIQAIQAIDQLQLERLRGLHHAFWDRWRPTERPAVARHRAELETLLAPCAGLCIAGGHVVILLNRLRLLGILDLCPGMPVIAWSAGAMALAQRVVLFHDSPPQGPGYVEVFEAGLGLIGGLLPFPHADQRLRLADPDRVALLAHRFAPDRCVMLSGGEMLQWTGERWSALRPTSRLGEDGALREVPT
jgi:hypothetical protein